MFQPGSPSAGSIRPGRHAREAEGCLGADEPSVVAARVVESHALADRGLPTPRRRRRFGDQDGSECAVAEVEQNGRRVVEVEVASHLGGGRLDTVDVTAHRPLQVDLVDEIHEQWSRAGGAPPLGLVVAVGLAHRDHRIGGDEPADVVRDRSGCRFDEVVVATVLPDEQVDAVMRGDRAQLLPRIQASRRSASRRAGGHRGGRRTRRPRDEAGSGWRR